MRALNTPFLVCLVCLLANACAQKDYSGRPDGPDRQDRSAYSKTAPTQRPYVINNITYYPIPDAAGYVESGIASWYGPNFHGRPTSNGEEYNMFEMTAAHKTLPMNTMLLVRNLDNGRETVVRINDRGPFVQGRVIDLSYKAAQNLEIVRPGVSRVQIVALAEKSLFARSSGGRSRLPDLQHGEYYVQIGAFSEQQNAANLQKKFTAAGHTAVIQKHLDPEATATYYRVHIYAGRELTAAHRAESALQQHGYAGAFVVAR
jgi:rare lipoprotein A